MTRWQRWVKKWGSLTIAGCLAIALIGCSLDSFRTQAAQGTRLVYSVLSDPATFNPALSKESPNIFTLTYAGLVEENGITAEVEPALAESWSFSEDDLRLTLTLRAGLRWSDGAPLTVDDVLFTYNEVLFNEAIPNNSRDGFRVGAAGVFPTVRQVGDRQVEFALPEPFAPLLRLLGTEILPAHILRPTVNTLDTAGNPVFNSTWSTDTPPSELVGNGMYQLSSYTNGERLVFERNPYYWRGEGQPYIDQVVWKLVESTESSLIQFRSGGLDLISVSPDYFALLKQEEDRGDFEIYNGGQAMGTTFMTFNLNTGSRNGKPLVDPVKSRWFNQQEFRQAIAYGLNRQQMVNNIYQGLGEAQNSPISVQSPYFLSPEAGLPTYDYDPDRARELLLSAGFQYNAENQLVDAEGNRVRFTLITNAGNKIREAMGAQIKQNLADIGIQVDFQPISFGALVDRLTDTLDWEAHLIGFTGGVEPHGGANVWRPDGELHAFNQSALAGQEPIEGRQVADWEQEIWDLFVQGSQEIDETQRKAIYAQAQVLVQAHLPFIYLVNPLSLAAVKNRVEGVEPTAVGGPLWNLHELKISE